jgi:hypothetical protein
MRRGANDGGLRYAISLYGGPEDRLMTIPFERLRRKWMKDAKFRAEYERIGPDMELAFTLAEASAANPKFAQPCSKSGCELRVQKRH